MTDNELVSHLSAEQLDFLDTYHAQSWVCSLLASLTPGRRVAVVPVRHGWGEFCHLMGPGIPTLKPRTSILRITGVLKTRTTASSRSRVPGSNSISGGNCSRNRDVPQPSNRVTQPDTRLGCTSSMRGSRRPPEKSVCPLSRVRLRVQRFQVRCQVSCSVSW